MSIRKQLIIVFTIVLLITLLVGYSGFVSLNSSEKEVLRLNKEMRYIDTNRELRASMSSLHDKIVDFALTNNNQEVEREMSVLNSALTSLDENLVNQSKIRQILHYIATKEIKSYLEKISLLSTEVEKYFEIENKRLMGDLSGEGSKLVDFAGDNKVKIMQELRKMDYQKTSILKTLDKLIEIGNKDIDIKVENMQGFIHSNKIIITAILIVAIILSIMIPLTMGNRIASPIVKLSDGVKKMGKHDLSQTIEKDRGLSTEVETIFEEVEHMRLNFIDLIKDLVKASEEIYQSSTVLKDNSNILADSSNSIKYAVEEIAQNTLNQAGNTQDLAQYFNMMNQHIEKEVHMVVDLEECNQSIKNVVLDSNRLVANLKEVSEDTSQQVGEIKTVIGQNNESISMIEQFINTINAISEQTNLLALNASIEAARAGEVGMGFSVVADEIRTLADNSKNSLEEMTAIISQIISDNNEVMNKISLLDKVDDKRIITVKQIVDSFHKIHEETISLNDISGILHEMAEKTSENFQNLVSNVEALSNISQENAAGSEEITSLIMEQDQLIDSIHRSSLILARLAEDMKQSTTKFQIM